MLRIKTLRLENDWSQRALAAKIGSSQKVVDCCEKGQTEPTAGFLIKLADCFGCSVDYLLGREDDYGNVNVDSDLSEEERGILYAYRALPADERKELMRFADYLAFRRER